jgi:hypothetical protein
MAKRYDYSIETAERVIKRHYGLTRRLTFQEIADEVSNLKRRKADMSLDSKQELLAAALNI